VSWQTTTTWKSSNDPDFIAKMYRVLAPQCLAAYRRHRPLLDQVLDQFRQAPGRKRADGGIQVLTKTRSRRRHSNRRATTNHNHRSKMIVPIDTMAKEASHWSLPPLA
jgi:hypothetical protein